VFETVESGELVVKRAASSSGFKLQMDLPNEAPGTSQPPFAGSVCKAVVGGSGLQVAHMAFNSRIKYLLLELKEGTSREQLESIKPDLRACLEKAGRQDINMVMITAKCSSGTCDFVSRCFAPWGGIDEDPATGSAHAVMGPWWAKKLGKDVLTARQCSPRGGELKVIVETNRVKLLSNAVILSRGHLTF